GERASRPRDSRRELGSSPRAPRPADGCSWLSEEVARGRDLASGVRARFSGRFGDFPEKLPSPRTYFHERAAAIPLWFHVDAPSRTRTNLTAPTTPSSSRSCIWLCSRVSAAASFVRSFIRPCLKPALGRRPSANASWA